MWFICLLVKALQNICSQYIVFNVCDWKNQSEWAGKVILLYWLLMNVQLKCKRTIQVYWKPSLTGKWSVSVG